MFHWHHPYLFATGVALLVGYVLFLAFRMSQAARSFLDGADALANDLRERERHIWQAIRYQGGGTVQSPTTMTELEAMEWVANTLGSIGFVDHTYHFIFYRPHGGG